MSPATPAGELGVLFVGQLICLAWFLPMVRKNFVWRVD